MSAVRRGALLFTSALCLLLGCAKEPVLGVAESPLRLASGKSRAVHLQVDRGGLEGVLTVKVSGLPDTVEVVASRVQPEADLATLTLRVPTFVPPGTQATAHIVVSDESGGRGTLDVPVVFEVSGGAVDPSFGMGGAMTEATPGSLGVCGLAPLPDGQVLLARVHPTEYVLEWRDADGALLRTVSVPGGPHEADAPGTLECGLSVDADGAFWFGGVMGTGATKSRRLFVTRFRPGGEVDVTFGDGGTARVPVTQWSGRDFEFRDLAVLADGHLLLAGGSRDHGSFLAKLTVRGTLDPDFAGQGVVASLEPNLSLRLMPLRDGRVLAAGSTAWVGYDGRWSSQVSAFQADGSRDPAYGDEGTGYLAGDGVLTGSFRMSAALLDPDGSVWAALERGDVAATDLPPARVALLTPRGALDGARWAPTGVRSLKAMPGLPLVPTTLDALARLPDGRVAAAAWMAWDRRRVALLLTLLPDGTLDPASADSALCSAWSPRSVPFPRPQVPLTLEQARGMVVLPDGRVLVVSNLFSRQGADDPWSADLHFARFFP